MSAEPVRVLPGEPAPRRGSSGCFIGCIIGIIISVVLVFVLVLGAGYFLTSLRDSLTSTEPVPVPQVQYTQEQAAQVQQEVAQFESALTNQQPAMLELTADELNTFIATDPRVSDFSDSFYVEIPGDALRAQLSLPLDWLPGMSGRYINGAATLDVDVVGEQFVISVREFSMPGMDVPSQALAQFEGEINSQLNTDQQVRDLARQIESIDVADGVLRVTLKGAQ